MKRAVPDELQMRMYLARELSQREIADRWYQDSGNRCGRSAIGMAISRYGLKSARPRERYMDMIPWEVRPEHQNHADLRLLRLEARRRRGKSLSDRELTWLTTWQLSLDREGVVIDYHPDTPAGFVRVPRTDEDDDPVVRRVGPHSLVGRP